MGSFLSHYLSPQTPLAPQKDSPLLRWSVSSLLLALLFTGLSWFLYYNYTIHLPGANDFLARWSNGCALVWSGANPYSEEATLATQMRMYGRPALPGEDKAAFSYPLHALTFFWPLCFIRDYAAVQAIWMSLMTGAIVAGTIVMMRVTAWRPSPSMLIVISLWTVFNYPHLRAIILGQMATVVFVAVGLALLALQKRRDGLAGAALAVAAIKPQLVFLLIPWLLWWSANQRRWRLWQGFFIAMAAMGGVGLLILPSWPLDFARAVLNYTENAGDSAPFGSLIWMLVRHILGLGLVAEIGITGLLAAFLLYEWWQQRHTSGEAMLWTTGLSLTLTHFVAYRVATTSYSLLLLPLFLLFRQSQKHAPRRANHLAWMALLALLVGQWAVFLSTRVGRFETVPPYLVMPIPLLLVQLAHTRAFRRGPAALTSKEKSSEEFAAITD